MGRPETEQVRPLQPPPYLASQTAARDSGPVEPWADTLRTLMMVFGGLLVIAFVVPWKLSPETSFAWTGLKSFGNYDKIMRIMIVGTGALAIILGALPLATLPRGIGAAILGLTPIVYKVFGAGHIDANVWRTLAVPIGAVTLASGLLLRSQYKSSMAARIMVTIGALAVIAMYVVPDHGNMMLTGIFDHFGDLDGRGKVRAILVLLPFALAVISLIAWIPAPSSAMGSPLAWTWITIAFVISVIGVLLSKDVGVAFKDTLGTKILSPMAAMAWLGLVSYGVATAVGKNLEHS